MASSIQATRLRKGMLIKIGNDLFRILDLHHLTPGNKRAHIQCRMRNIRSMTLSDQKFRAEEDIERAMQSVPIRPVKVACFSDAAGLFFAFPEGAGAVAADDFMPASMNLRPRRL